MPFPPLYRGCLAFMQGTISSNDRFFSNRYYKQVGAKRCACNALQSPALCGHLDVVSNVLLATQVILGDAFFGSDRALADNNATLAFVEVRPRTHSCSLPPGRQKYDCAGNVVRMSCIIMTPACVWRFMAFPACLYLIRTGGRTQAYAASEELFFQKFSEQYFNLTWLGVDPSVPRLGVNV